jgi:hypothetical protein
MRKTKKAESVNVKESIDDLKYLHQPAQPSDRAKTRTSLKIDATLEVLGKGVRIIFDGDDEQETAQQTIERISLMLRIKECVNAFAGVEHPDRFMATAKRARATCLEQTVRLAHYSNNLDLLDAKAKIEKALADLH